MPNYNLDRLGSTEFERMIQSLIKHIIGDGTITFGAGKDGAREATYQGSAPYPSASERFAGKWIFQAKYHDINLLGMSKARKQVLSDLESELDVITNKYKHECDNYILATNVPLTGAAESGNLDTIQNKVIPKFKHAIKNIHIWAADDINRYLEKYSDVRIAYLDFIVPGDVLHQLIRAQQRELDETAETVKQYINALFNREQDAQLDQAGDVSDEPVRIQQVFFDLKAFHDVELNSSRNRKALERLESFMRANSQASSYYRGQYVDEQMTVSPLQLLTNDAVDRLVIVGGPGEGKSTIGQYLAQLHRACLMGKMDEILIDESFAPVIPRLPLRVVLRDFAQWLARREGADNDSPSSLDQYIVEHIVQATSRTLTTKELHRVIKENPTLLIFDGLDEVSGEEIRRTLLNQLAEFVDKCRTSLKADVQVLAATRPTGYTNQFDPKTYVHLRLVRLVPEQVRDYVAKWIKARTIEPSKAARLSSNIEECLADPQIRLLMNTPLQVTILVLIISSGGTPPRQREALFNEYLEVIYKRETAKGKNVISSEKEKLVGLHKYIGYVLHQKATDATAAGAVLKREDYEREVIAYLRHCDPYSSSDAIRSIQTVITRDAGERLVLLVEPRPDIFGFELRSIQEFFAACHIADTSPDTATRYQRFDVIARLDHWRNVALFFAGRVGRNYSGETSNIVDVCHHLNREKLPSIIKKGSLLALELAADRAFGPNRKQQRRLLEIGLELVIGKTISERRMAAVVELLQKLPTEDHRDHLTPLIEQHIEVLDAGYLTHLPVIVNACKLESGTLIHLMRKLARNSETSLSALESVGILQLNRSQIGSDLLRELASSTEDSDLVELLLKLRLDSLLHLVDRLTNERIDNVRVYEILRAIFTRPSAILRSNASLFLHSGPAKRPTSFAGELVYCLFSVLKVLRTEREILISSRFDDKPTAERLHRGTLNLLPEYVVDGTIDDTLCEAQRSVQISNCLATPLWIMHILLGEITEETTNSFLRFFSEHAKHGCFTPLATDLVNLWSPTLELILDVALSPDHRDLNDLRPMLMAFGGKQGIENFAKFLGDVERWAPTLSESEYLDTIKVGLSNTRISAPDSILHASSLPYGNLLVEMILTGDRYFHHRKIRKYHFDVANIAYHRLEGGNPLTTHTCRQLSFLTLSQSSHLKASVETAERSLSLFFSRGEPATRKSVQVACKLIVYLYQVSSVRDSLLEEMARFLASADLDTDSIYFHVPDKRAIAFMLRDSLKLHLKVDDAQLRRGLRALIDITVPLFKIISRNPSTPDRPAFPGFGKNHREFASQATTHDEMRTALLLFTLRKLNAAADWRSLSDCLTSTTSNNIDLFFQSLPDDVLRDPRNRLNWLSLIETILPNNAVESTAPALSDAIAVLLAEADQSLATIGPSLGLPLASE